jgi:hypothetical protein
MPLDSIEFLLQRSVVCWEHLRRRPWILLSCIVVAIAIWTGVGFGIHALIAVL